MKYLIINGDDLCLDRHTDKAILEAYHQGVLTSTSAFVNLPGALDNLIKLHDENPDIPIGLHFNMTLGKPISAASEIKNLVDDNGFFYPIDKILRRLPDMPAGEVKKELAAQAELFISSGVPLSHIDYHHHLAALYTPFFEAVREVAREYGVPIRNPVPVSIYKIIDTGARGGGGSASMRKLILYGVTHPFKSIPMMSKVGPDAFIAQEKLMAEEGIISSDWFIDSFYENASVENFISILAQLPHGVSELMCHPGIEEELKVLVNPSVKRAIDSLQVQIVSWRHFD